MSIDLNLNIPKQNQQVIMNLNSISAREVGKVLKKIETIIPNCPLIIRNSKINQPIITDDFILNMDLSSLIGSGVNMAMILITPQIKEVIHLLSSGETQVISDPDDGCYIFKNDHRLEKLTAFEDAGQGPDQTPIFSSTDYLGLPVTIKNIKDVKQYIRKSSSCGLLIYNNQLEQVLSFDRNTPYNFNKVASGSINSENPEICLVSFNFLKISDKDTTINLAANDGRGFWLITEVKMSPITTIKTFELLSMHNA